MPDRLPPLTVLAILLAMLLPSASASEPAPTDLVIGSDTVVEGQALLVPGSVVVLPGATLDLRGTTVLVGQEVKVLPGATLLMGPHADAPSRLLAPPDDRFHITIEGTMRTAGTPRTLIQGLDGEGLNSVLLLPGGLKINGTADLRDVDIRDGTAGLTVGPRGVLVMRDASFSGLYLMGLAVLGQATLENVTAADNIIGVTGKGASCRIEVRDSLMRNWAANFQLNGCQATIEGSRLEGSGNNVANGQTRLVLRDSGLVGYQNTGLRLENGATAWLERVRIEAGPDAPERGIPQLGVDVRAGSRLVAERIEVGGNIDDGVRVSGGAARVLNSSLDRNGGYGMALQGAATPDGLATIRFQGNAHGALSHTMAFQARFLGPDGNPLQGLGLEVRAADGALVFQGSESSALPLQVRFEAYGTTLDGQPVFLGPFRYHALAAGAEPMEGEVPQDAAWLNIQAELPPAAQFPWLQAGALAASLVLLAAVLLLRPRRPARDGP